MRNVAYAIEVLVDEFKVNFDFSFVLRKGLNEVLLKPLFVL